MISLPIKTTALLLKVSWKSLRGYMSMLLLLWSAFLRIYMVATFSLDFTVTSFSLLSTFKNIAITQNLHYNLKPRTTQPKRGCFNLSKSIVKPFLSSGLNKTSL